MSDEFMKRPTQRVLKVARVQSLDDFNLGRFAMALEIITVIRTLESVPAMGAVETASVVNVLETLLVDQELERAYELYEVLSATRRPVFVREPSPGGIERASSSSQLGQASESDGDASDGAALEGGSSPVDVLRGLAEERRSQGTSSIDEQGELTDEAPGETSSE